jgi:histidine triad (HIT) family protein
MKSIFTKIIERELPADIVFENERLIAIKDIHPSAPVHLLIISKKEIPNLQSVSFEDLPLVAEMVEVAQQLATQFGIADGYRLLTNNGANAGQIIPHLHFHLLGGRHLGAIAS